MTEVLCYNKGCGQKYDPTQNSDGCCQYHPGGPIFHDALKGWSCCSKKSTDFTEFLNFPGCTKGPHSNVKPVDLEKAKPINDVPVPEPVAAPRQPVPSQKAERPSEDEPMVRLKASVSDSLRQAIEKQLQKLSLEQSEAEGEGDNNKITVGTTCKNKGCKGSYQDESSDNSTCQYHPGVAIFHEGMKYWSCCKRKTSDFSNFLDQEGCEKGKHLWISKEDPNKKKDCRMDWFQTGPNVNISVFSKLAVPDDTFVEANKVKCNIRILYDGGKSLFEKTLILRNAIDPTISVVKMVGTKVEIVLKKSEAFSWATLEVPAQSVTNNSH